MFKAGFDRASLLLLLEVCLDLCVTLLTNTASGAGKTTLLSALSQRLPTATGDFQIDGKPLPPAFQRLIGFVEQADVS